MLLVLLRLAVFRVALSTSGGRLCLDARLP
jgi:hypothetical protein